MVSVTARQCRINAAYIAVAIMTFAFAAKASDFTPPDKDKALEALKSHIADAAKSGKKIEAWLSIFGSPQKFDLASADAKFVCVKIDASNTYQQPWSKISEDQVASLGKNCVLGDAQRALALADYCMATEQREKADQALELAAQSSTTLGNALSDRWKFVKSMAGAPVAVASASSSSSSGSADAGPVKYAAPAKLAFKASEPGYLAPVKDVAAAIDNSIEIDLAEMGIKPEALCDDCAFLRRASLDLTGQIPTPEEVIAFYGAGSGADKRSKKIDEILARPEYADHWGTFWHVILVGRRTQDQDDVKVAPFKTWLRDQFSKNVPFNQIVTDILTAEGDNRTNGPVNYLTYHLAGTLPNTMAHLSQTFLGARIGCAQCHDHPFDKWSQQDFWGFASFIANTKSERRERKIKDPKEPSGERVVERWRELVDFDQRVGERDYEPPQPELRLPPKPLDGPVYTDAPVSKLGKDLKGGDKKAAGMDKSMGMDKGMAMDKSKGMDKGMAMDKSKGMDKGMAMDKGMGMMGGSGSGYGEKGMNYRKALAAWITDPKNEKFNQSAVNRIWRAMFGYGLVEPVDDIRPKNAPSHPEAMKILADDFSASGRDWKRLCAVIANTKAYQRAANGSLEKIDRAKAVRYAARAEVRPMTPEMLFTAILKATGGEEKAKALITDLHSRDEAMMSGGMDKMNPEVGQFYDLMRRFINTSTAEDRAGKLQFEGTVSQALMMMHNPFMIDSIKKGVQRFTKKSENNLTFLFAAALGRAPDGAEASAFSNIANKPDEVLWILLNSAEFVTIH